MGMKEWFAPQISEHWPIKILAVLLRKLIWFRRPGVASIFIPRAGIVHAWRTSAAVTNIRVWILNGKIMLLSVSNKRKEDVFKVLIM